VILVQAAVAACEWSAVTVVDFPLMCVEHPPTQTDVRLQRDLEDSCHFQVRVGKLPEKPHARKWRCFHCSNQSCCDGGVGDGGGGARNAA
jgi:hypothetical protein